MSDNDSLSCTNSLVTITVVINHRNIPKGPRCLQWSNTNTLGMWGELILLPFIIIDHFSKYKYIIFVMYLNNTIFKYIAKTMYIF